MYYVEQDKTIDRDAGVHVHGLLASVKKKSFLRGLSSEKEYFSQKIVPSVCSLHVNLQFSGYMVCLMAYAWKGFHILCCLMESIYCMV